MFTIRRFLWRLRIMALVAVGVLILCMSGYGDGDNGLFEAVRKGKKEKVMIILDREGKVNRYSARGRTPLMIAAGQGHLEMVKALIDRGADLHLKDRDGDLEEHQNGDTALMYAARAGKLPVVRYLLKQGAKLHHTNKLKESALHQAASEGHSKLVSFLIERGARVNRRNKYGQNIVFYAALAGRPEVVKILLRNGAEPSAKDNENRSPLMFALMLEKKRTARALIDHGANFTQKVTGGQTAFERVGEEDGDTTLIVAARRGYVKAVKKLLKKASEKEVNAQNRIKETALIEAADNVHPEVVKVLLKNGADVSMKDVHLETPLQKIARNVERKYDRRRMDIARMLLNHGAKIKPNMWYARSLLVAAVVQGRKKIVDGLMEQGVDVSHGTLIYWAAKEGRLEMINYFLNKEEDVNLDTTLSGVTPLMAAAEGGHLKAVKRLLEAGADPRKESKGGRSAYELAQKYKHNEVAQLLKAKTKKIRLQKKMKEIQQTSYKRVGKSKEKVVRRLIRQLGRKQYEKRQEAARKLIEMGKKILFYLKKNQNHKNPEIRTQIRRIIREIARKHL